MNPILMAIGASLLISLVSLTGIIFFKVRRKILKKELLIIVGLATGALLGDAFLHLIPEAMPILGEETGLWVVLGILIFFVLEKFLKWHHCHELDYHQEKELAWISLTADSIHNLIDGLIIGSSFMISVPLGISTSTAVLLHEIPQEIGDLVVLIHCGYSLKKATLMNLSSAIISLIGVLIVWILGNKINIQGELTAITAGGFVYLAASDLIPELHKQQSRIRESFYQLLAVIIGIVIMRFLV